MFCTDGIIEAVNPSGEFFGAERLVELCAAHANVPGPELLEHLFAAVKNFADGQAQYDDMAATVFHCAGIGEDAAITTA